MNDLLRSEFFLPDQKSNQKRDRIPPEHQGVQVNTCENPACENFCIPVQNSRADPNYRISGSIKPVREHYQTTGLGAATSVRVIICKKCSESIPLKKNRSIVETIESLSWSPDNHCCANNQCSNHQEKIDLSSGIGFYVKRGKTATGNQRWKCKECGKSFVVVRSRYPASNGAQSHKYVSSIKALVNTTQIKKLMEIQKLQKS